MAFSFIKKTATTPAASKPANAGKSALPSSGSGFGAKKTGSSGFLKTGAAAKQAFIEAEAQSAANKEKAGKMFRFFMAEGESRTITFLDGDTGEDGLLDIPLFKEHAVKLAGKTERFICTDDREPCPICAKGDNQATLVGCLTVLNHTPYTIQNGPNAGKTLTNRRQLFLCKRETYKLLSKLAEKRGGLAGCTFEVSRTGEKKPGVGDLFDFVVKYDDPSQLAAKYDLPIEEVQPANYEEELTFHTAEELVNLGVGKAVTGSGIGYEKGVDTKKLADQL